MSSKLNILIAEQQKIVSPLIQQVNRDLSGRAYLTLLKQVLENQKNFQKKWKRALEKNPTHSEIINNNITRLEGLIDVLENYKQDAFKSVDQSLNKLTTLLDLTKITDQDQFNEQLINELFEVTRLLFLNRINPDNIFNQLKQNNDARLGYHYIKRIVLLSDIIDRIPEQFQYKQILQQTIHDHCNLSWIKKFKQGELTTTDVKTFITQHHTENLVNSIDILSWGTANEISNGLKSIINHSRKNGGWGHVSITMRLAVNDENKKIINDYCVKPNGEIQIPYELKKYADQTVYEVHWSYTPSEENSPLPFELQTLKQDIQLERSELEYLENQAIHQAMPDDLRALIFLQKKRRGKTTDFFPVAMKNPKSIESDPHRQDYLFLKHQKYKLNEEIESLKIMMDNYLHEDKESTFKILKEKPLRDESNFLFLLRRFKSQLPNNLSIPKILQKKEVSVEEASHLHEAFKSLIAAKRREQINIKDKIKLTANMIQSDHNEIKNLKNIIKKTRSNLKLIQTQINAYVKLLEFLNSKIADISLSYPIDLPNELVPLLRKFNQANPAEKIGLSVIDQKNISAEQLKQLQNKITLAHTFNCTKLSNAQNKIREHMEKLHQNYTQRDQEQIDLKETQLESLNEKITQLSSSSNLTTSTEIEKLKLNKKQLQHEIYCLKLSPHRSVEDLIHENIIRGAHHETIRLSGFNIEQMLKTASHIAKSNTEFDLYLENCSTTSMKILNAGAPEQLKSLFQWSEFVPKENIPSNMFITNPQTVYSAARIAEGCEHGDPMALNYLKKTNHNNPKKYYKKLNQLASMDDNLLEKKIISPLEIIQIILSLIPHIFELLHDWFPYIEKPKKTATSSAMHKLDLALKNSKTQAYLLIRDPVPISAIAMMMNELKNAPDSIPFFDNQTLEKIDQFILTLEATENKTKEDEALVKQFEAIINERNARVDCVQQAIFKDQNAILALRERSSTCDQLTWQIPIEVKIDAFNQQYRTLRNQNQLTLFRSQFTHQLNKLPSDDEKLNAIQEHAQKKPHSRTAQTLKTLEKHHIKLFNKKDSSPNTDQKNKNTPSDKLN